MTDASVCQRRLGCVLLASLLLAPSLQRDTVAEDVSVRQLERLVELLTLAECEELRSALSKPKEDVFQQPEQLPAEEEQLDRKKRDATSTEDPAAQCRAALTEWLLNYGEQTDYERLSRALQGIGRTDIAMEIGKNINQDKILSLKRYVEDYHKFVSSLNVPPAQSSAEDHQHVDPRAQTRKVRDLSWHDLDLIVERPPVPPYRKGPLDVALPLLYGALLGFGGTLLAGALVLFLVIHVSRRDQRCQRPGVAARSAEEDVALEEVACGETV